MHSMFKYNGGINESFNIILTWFVQPPLYINFIIRIMYCQTQCETKMLLGKSRFKHSRGGKLFEHLWPFSKLTLLSAVSLFIF